MLLLALFSVLAGSPGFKISLLSGVLSMNTVVDGAVPGDATRRRNDSVGVDTIYIGVSGVRVYKEMLRQLKSLGRMFIPVNDDKGS